MDYMTKPLSRTGVRNISKLVRRIFNLTPDEPFPVLRILDKLCVTFPRTEYQIVEDDKLPKTVFAWCFPKPEDGFKIEIKQTVYDEAFSIITDLSCALFATRYAMSYYLILASPPSPHEH